MFSEGDKLGTFEITGLLGKGGMGEVYRARDMKLGREVAVKVLPVEFAEDGERLARFEREAKLLAALDHPNIGALYDFQHVDGTHFLVLQLVEGETLADRIMRGPVPLDEALQIFVQIAEALECAHEHGIVHRDLKPANVKVSDDGRVKVLDFGIAKSVERSDENTSPTPTPSSPDATTLASTPTPPTSLTGRNMLVGTPAYMSPEQAKGRQVDKRADIWAFGCCLLESLTGKLSYRGDSVAETISHVLRDEPDLSGLPENTPPSVAALIGRCLEKDPKRRLRDIGEAWFTLNEAMTGASTERPESTLPRDPRKQRSFVGPLAAAFAIGAIAAILALSIMQNRSNTPKPKTTFSISPLTTLVGVEYQSTWSPDGNFIAFDSTTNGSLDIFVQSAAGDKPRLLVSGPSDDAAPRWSPDGRYIAFFSNRDEASSIYLIPALGGPIRKLASTYKDRNVGLPRVFGGNPWSPDSRNLLLSRHEENGSAHILKVDIESGEETQLTFPDEGIRDTSPSWSHDGKRIVFAREKSQVAGLLLMPAEGGEPQPLLVDGFHNHLPAWSQDDKRIVFSSERGTVQNLWEIDVESPKEPRRLTVAPNTHRHPAISKSGRIAYSATSHLTDLYTTSVEDGTTEQLTFDTDENFGAQFSPNGKEIAYHSQKAGNEDIWILDRDSLVERQLTFSPHTDVYPTWSPDGTEIAFVSRRSGDFDIWIVNAEGGTPRRLTDIGIQLRRTAAFVAAGGPRWSPDGKAIGVRARSENSVALWLVDMEHETVEKTLDNVGKFEWYRDSRHVIYTPTSEGGHQIDQIRAANLDTGEEKVLFVGLHREIAVSKDGHRLSYILSESHFNMNLYMLELSPPDPETGLPSTVGDPVELTAGKGRWHVHNGGWSPDGREVVYTRDTDDGNIYVIDTID